MGSLACRDCHEERNFVVVFNVYVFCEDQHTIELTLDAILHAVMC